MRQLPVTVYGGAVNWLLMLPSGRSQPNDVDCAVHGEFKSTTRLAVKHLEAIGYTCTPVSTSTRVIVVNVTLKDLFIDVEFSNQSLFPEMVDFMEHNLSIEWDDEGKVPSLEFHKHPPHIVGEKFWTIQNAVRNVKAHKLTIVQRIQGHIGNWSNRQLAWRHAKVADWKIEYTTDMLPISDAVVKLLKNGLSPISPLKAHALLPDKERKRKTLSNQKRLFDSVQLRSCSHSDRYNAVMQEDSRWKSDPKYGGATAPRIVVPKEWLLVRYFTKCLLKGPDGKKVDDLSNHEKQLKTIADHVRDMTTKLLIVLARNSPVHRGPNGEFFAHHATATLNSVLEYSNRYRKMGRPCTCSIKSGKCGNTTKGACCSFCYPEQYLENHPDQKSRLANRKKTTCGSQVCRGCHCDVCKKRTAIKSGTPREGTLRCKHAGAKNLSFYMEHVLTDSMRFVLKYVFSGVSKESRIFRSTLVRPQQRKNLTTQYLPIGRFPNTKISGVEKTLIDIFDEAKTPFTYDQLQEWNLLYSDWRTNNGSGKLFAIHDQCTIVPSALEKLNLSDEQKDALNADVAFWNFDLRLKNLLLESRPLQLDKAMVQEVKLARQNLAKSNRELHKARSDRLNTDVLVKTRDRMRAVCTQIKRRQYLDIQMPKHQYVMQLGNIIFGVQKALNPRSGRQQRNATKIWANFRKTCCPDGDCKRREKCKHVHVSDSRYDFLQECWSKFRNVGKDEALQKVYSTWAASCKDGKAFWPPVKHAKISYKWQRVIAVCGLGPESLHSCIGVRACHKHGTGQCTFIHPGQYDYDDAKILDTYRRVSGLGTGHLPEYSKLEYLDINVLDYLDGYADSYKELSMLWFKAKEECFDTRVAHAPPSYTVMDAIVDGIIDIICAHIRETPGNEHYQWIFGSWIGSEFVYSSGGLGDTPIPTFLRVLGHKRKSGGIGGQSSRMGRNELLPNKSSEIKDGHRLPTWLFNATREMMASNRKIFSSSKMSDFQKNKVIHTLSVNLCTAANPKQWELAFIKSMKRRHTRAMPVHARRSIAAKRNRSREARIAKFAAMVEKQHEQMGFITETHVRDISHICRIQGADKLYQHWSANYSETLGNTLIEQIDSLSDMFSKIRVLDAKLTCADVTCTDVMDACVPAPLRSRLQGRTKPYLREPAGTKGARQPLPIKKSEFDRIFKQALGEGIREFMSASPNSPALVRDFLQEVKTTRSSHPAPSSDKVTLRHIRQAINRGIVDDSVVTMFTDEAIQDISGRGLRTIVAAAYGRHFTIDGRLPSGVDTVLISAVDCKMPISDLAQCVREASVLAIEYFSNPEFPGKYAGIANICIDRPSEQPLTQDIKTCNISSDVMDEYLQMCFKFANTRIPDSMFVDHKKQFDVGTPWAPSLITLSEFMVRKGANMLLEIKSNAVKLVKQVAQATAKANAKAAKVAKATKGKTGMSGGTRRQVAAKRARRRKDKLKGNKGR
jgi:hypothetical protein